MYSNSLHCAIIEPSFHRSCKPPHPPKTFISKAVWIFRLSEMLWIDVWSVDVEKMYILIMGYYGSITQVFCRFDSISSIRCHFVKFWHFSLVLLRFCLFPCHFCIWAEPNLSYQSRKCELFFILFLTIPPKTWEST